jgi:hypothetical protein
MYKNSYVVKPGEKLTPQQLFERYLDWSYFKDFVVVPTLSMRTSCDEDLRSSNLCCEEHWKLQTERNIFFHYFHHLGMVKEVRVGFSTVSMASMITKFNLKIDDSIRQKLKNYWGDAAPYLFKHLERETS